MTLSRRGDHGALIETPDLVLYGTTIKTITARDANQNFSKVLAEVEQGETVLITKNGRTVAELRPRADDPGEDLVYCAKFEHMMQLMRETPDTSYRVGKITGGDKYGDAPIGSAV